MSPSASECARRHRCRHKEFAHSFRVFLFMIISLEFKTDVKFFTLLMTPATRLDQNFSAYEEVARSKKKLFFSPFVNIETRWVRLVSNLCLVYRELTRYLYFNRTGWAWEDWFGSFAVVNWVLVEVDQKQVGVGGLKIEMVEKKVEKKMERDEKMFHISYTVDCTRKRKSRNSKLVKNVYVSCSVSFRRQPVINM